MLKSISWTQYISLIAVSASLYYILIVVLYYRQNLVLLFKKSLQWDGTIQHIKKAKGKTIEHEGKGPAEKQALMQGINILIKEAVHNNYTKELLLTALRNKIQKYPHFRNTSSQAAINEYILIETNINRTVELDEIEVMLLWEE